MGNAPADLIAFGYRRTHERVLALVDDLSDEQLAWRHTAVHSIAWNLWHLARWADHLQERIPHMTAELGRRLGMSRQVWEAEGLAARWGFTPAALGHAETGMLMDDEAVLSLPFPAKEAQLEYARRAFALAERAVEAIDDQQFRQPNATEQAGPDTPTVGSAVLTHLTHDNRHLGEIECLRGLQGLRGTATR